MKQIQASDGAFSAILGDGSVVAWGAEPDDFYPSGADSTAVQDQLKNVQQIQISDRAFAAILDNGAVVTWGAATNGGDSSAVHDQVLHLSTSVRWCW